MLPCPAEEDNANSLLLLPRNNTCPCSAMTIVRLMPSTPSSLRQNAQSTGPQKLLRTLSLNGLHNHLLDIRLRRRWIPHKPGTSVKHLMIRPRPIRTSPTNRLLRRHLLHRLQPIRRRLRIHIRIEHLLPAILRLLLLLLRGRISAHLLLILRLLRQMLLLHPHELLPGPQRALLAGRGVGDGVGAHRGVVRSTLVLGCGVFPWHDVDEEVEHVAFGERGGDVAALEGAAFVFFRVDPGAHGEFGDEHVAAFGEEDGGFGADHFYFWVGFHHFFYSREGQLVHFVVVVFGFEFGYLVLPVGVEDVAVGAAKAL